MDGYFPFHANSPGLDALRAGWVRDCLEGMLLDSLEIAGTVSHPVLEAHSVLLIPDDIARSPFAWRDLRCGLSLHVVRRSGRAGSAARAQCGLSGYVAAPDAARQRRALRFFR